MRAKFVNENWTRAYSNKYKNPKFFHSYNSVVGSSHETYKDDDGNHIKFYVVGPEGKRELAYSILGGFWMSSSGEDYGHKEKRRGIVPKELQHKFMHSHHYDGYIGRMEVVEWVLNQINTDI